MNNIPITIIPNWDWTYTVLSNVFNIVTHWGSIEEAIINWKEALECHIEWLEKDDIEYDYYSNINKSINTFVTA